MNGHRYRSVFSLDTQCGVCGRAFDHANQIEIQPGLIACPFCVSPLNQDGDRVKGASCGCGPLVIGGTVRRPDGGHKSRKEFAMLRKSFVPEGGWTSEIFHTPHGAALLHDIYAGRLAVLVPAIRRFSVVIKNLVERQCNDAITRFRELVAQHRHFRSVKVMDAKVPMSFTIDLGELAPLWSHAIMEALASSGIEMTVHAKPSLQSVAAAVEERTSILLGTKPQSSTNAVQARTNRLAQQVTRINDTTRHRLEVLLESEYEDNRTIAETVDAMKLRIPQIADSRAPTIARTELGRAADEGMKFSYINSGVVTHVSVIGCEAIEARSPHYKGIPTCNIQDVPIHDVDLLEWHINHTGCIIPSQFRDADGRVPNVVSHEGFPGQDSPD